jgi:heptosyltransferase-2
VRILVAQPLYLGDLVLTTPLLQHLRHAFPQAQVDVLVRPGVEDLLLTHPAVSNVLTRSRAGFVAEAKRLRQRGYDIALVLPGSVRTAMAIRLAGIPRRIGTDQSSGMMLFASDVKYPSLLGATPGDRTVVLAERAWRRLGGHSSFVSGAFTDVVRLDKTKDAAQRFVQLAAPLGIEEDPTLLLPRLYPGREDALALDRELQGMEGKRLVAMAPGSLWATKRWPAERYGEVARRLIEAKSGRAASGDAACGVAGCGVAACGVAVIGSTADRGQASGMVSNLPASGVLNLSGRLTPLQTAELLRRCAVLLSNDSAPVHIARAMGTPTIVIFGPTVPAFGYAPTGPGNVIVERQALPCRPCTPHGSASCPIGTHECMVSIQAGEVFAQVLEACGHAAPRR